jgi:hypothetical protein
MQHQYLVLIFSALCVVACRPAGPEEIPLPTKICVTTSHHGQPIPHAKVWLKYNADSFPGYNQPPSYFDASFESDANAHGCIGPVPEGRHWLIAFGYDSLHFPNDVFGSVVLDVSIPYRQSIDTMLYVSEKH